MQPCAVCGGVGIDAAGYCTQCRTFRGVPVQPPAPPQAYPGYQQPTGMPPAYPQQTSGGGYPMSYPPAQPARSRSFLLPLVALSATLAVLVAAIVVVVAVRSGGTGPEPIADPTTGAPTALATSAVATEAGSDECVVGTWRAISHKEEVSVPGEGKVTFTGGSGATLRLNADGTGETDYASGTEFKGEMSGQAVRLEVSGRVTYSYTAKDGTVSISDLESTATARFFLDGEQYGDTLPLPGSEDSSTYTCSTTHLTQKTFLYTTEYERVS
jgi:hypothetical protein